MCAFVYTFQMFEIYCLLPNKTSEIEVFHSNISFSFYEIVRLLCSDMRNQNIMSSDQTNPDNQRTNGNERNYIQLQQSQKIRKTLYNMSHLLNTGLSAETLDVCIRLCEAGVHPEALADIVNSIRTEMEALNRENF